VFGHKWEPAEGTIVSRENGPAGPGYVVDVRKSGGARLRAQVEAPAAMGSELPRGTAVRVEVNAKTGDVRFADNPVVRVGAGSAGPGAAVQVTLGPGTRISSGTTEVRVTGGTAEISVTGGSARIQVTRTPVTPGGAQPPSPFGPVPGPPPAPADPFGGPAGPPGFGQPALGGCAAADSVGRSFDSLEGSKSERIAALQEQRNRGELTEMEFQARRQQILDEF
jgi:hypothetical protein